MQRTETEELRKPLEILAAMDKDGVREDPKLLSQLNAELSVSLAVQAEEVSRRNLRIASIACWVAVIALGISILQTFRGGGFGQSSEVDATEYQKQVDTFNERSRIANDQLTRSEAQLSRAEKHTERTDVQLSKAEKQGERMDALIQKWEEQAKSQDGILAAISNRLKAAASENNNKDEQAAPGQPATRHLLK